MTNNIAETDDMLTVMEWKLMRTDKESVQNNLEYYPNIYMEKLRKTGHYTVL